MNLEKIVSISGPLANGLFLMTTNRSNGLIVENVDTGKRKFVPTRRHQFTPLNTIGIYMKNGDTTDIADVFKKIMEQEADNPPVAPSSNDEVLREYFTDILPDHDQKQVYSRDIKRVIKWYTLLKAKGLLEEEETSEEETKAAASADAVGESSDKK